MKKVFLLLFTLTFSFYAKAQDLKPIEIIPDFPLIIVADTEIKILLKSDDKNIDLEDLEMLSITVNGKEASIISKDSEVYVNHMVRSNEKSLVVNIGEATFHHDINPIPLWMSIIPPLIAILLALMIREVITSLFIGIFSGTLIIGLYGQGLGSILLSFLHVVDVYIVKALYDESHISVIIFSMTIAAVVAVISKNGGMRGIVNRLAPYAHNAKSGQLVIWFMGILIFFDDYANTLVVGNTMRPIADKLRISREKLAYLVDSTAAPVAAIAFITTWIGAELGYIESGIAEISTISESPYSIFLHSLPYAFYPILTLIFMLMLILKERDFGSMLKAEKQARKSKEIENDPEIESSDGEFDSKAGVIPRAYNALIPIIVIVFGAVAGMFYTGYSADVWNNNEWGLVHKISMTIGEADSFLALLWSSVSGLFIAIVMSVAQRILKLHEAMESAFEGYKTMLPAMFILILAWSLAYITEDMHTAIFLKGLWSSSLSPIFIPAIVFILSALVSFSTGSSWGTMAILYPLLLPASYQIAVESGMGHEEAIIIFYNVVSVILAGSVFGDHCSPISDTTILSSLASSCNHIDHVRTQLPYAITVGLVSILFGSIPAAMGISSWILFPIAIVVLYAIIHFIGKESPSS
jgi:Na+/H+ antiporter NhaC